MAPTWPPTPSKALNSLRTPLNDFGLAEADLGEAVELIAPHIPESNPRSLGRGRLQAALLGELLKAGVGFECPISPDQLRTAPDGRH